MASLETERLRRQPWRVEDASFPRRLWAERDPRVPAHRRLTADGRPVIAEARRIGYESLAATLRDWNTASPRVLDKLGFLDPGEREEDAVHGVSLLLRMTLVTPGTSRGRRSATSR